MSARETLGIASGFATHVHAGENGLAVARAVPRPLGIFATGHATARLLEERHSGQRADEDCGSQGLPGVDDRSCSG